MARHLDPLRVLQELIGDPGNLGRHGGRENQGLAGEGRELEDTFDIGDEPHIQHPVGLIHHHDFNCRQHQLAAFEMIQKPPGCGNQDIDATINQAVLVLEADATNQERHREFLEFRIGFEILGHLGGQFPRRCKHQRTRHPRPGPALGQMRDHRQGKGRGLPGPGLGNTQNIPPLKGNGNGLFLNWCRGLIACFGNGAKHVWIKFQVGKSCHSSSLF